MGKRITFKDKKFGKSIKISYSKAYIKIEVVFWKLMDNVSFQTTLFLCKRSMLFSPFKSNISRFDLFFLAFCLTFSFVFSFSFVLFLYLTYLFAFCFYFLFSFATTYFLSFSIVKFSRTWQLASGTSKINSS